MNGNETSQQPSRFGQRQINPMLAALVARMMGGQGQQVGASSGMGTQMPPSSGPRGAGGMPQPATMQPPPSQVLPQSGAAGGQPGLLNQMGSSSMMNPQMLAMFAQQMKQRQGIPGAGGQGSGSPGGYDQLMSQFAGAIPNSFDFSMPNLNFLPIGGGLGSP